MAELQQDTKTPGPQKVLYSEWQKQNKYPNKLLTFYLKTTLKKNKALRKRAKRIPLSCEAEFQHEHPNSPRSSTWTKAALFQPCAVRSDWLCSPAWEGAVGTEQGTLQELCPSAAVWHSVQWFPSFPKISISPSRNKSLSEANYLPGSQRYRKFLFHLHPQVHRIQKGLSTSRKTQSLQTDCYKLKIFTIFKDYAKSPTMGCSSVLKHFSTSAISLRSCGILAHSKPGTGIKMGLFHIL